MRVACSHANSPEEIRSRINHNTTVLHTRVHQVMLPVRVETRACRKNLCTVLIIICQSVVNKPQLYSVQQVQQLHRFICVTCRVSGELMMHSPTTPGKSVSAFLTTHARMHLGPPISRNKPFAMTLLDSRRRACDSWQACLEHVAATIHDAGIRRTKASTLPKTLSMPPMTTREGYGASAGYPSKQVRLGTQPKSSKSSPHFLRIPFRIQTALPTGNFQGPGTEGNKSGLVVTAGDLVRWPWRATTEPKTHHASHPFFVTLFGDTKMKQAWGWENVWGHHESQESFYKLP